MRARCSEYLAVIMSKGLAIAETLKEMQALDELEECIRKVCGQSQTHARHMHRTTCTRVRMCTCTYAHKISRAHAHVNISCTNTCALANAHPFYSPWRFCLILIYCSRRSPMALPKCAPPRGAASYRSYRCGTTALSVFGRASITPHNGRSTPTARTPLPSRPQLQPPRRR